MCHKAKEAGTENTAQRILFLLLFSLTTKSPTDLNENRIWS